jgi:hypothetical protein
MKSLTQRFVARLAVVLALVFVLTLSASAQQPSITLKGGVTYSDQSSQSCEQQNQGNPYAGMNPFACKGVSAPTDSRGGCSLGGWQVIKKEGNTCYYCSPVTVPQGVQGIIVPMDQISQAGNQGWSCGVNQADACTAVCFGNSGSSYNPSAPPPGRVTSGGPPTNPSGPPPGYASGPPGPGANGSWPGATACAPYGPGGYDYCQNPQGTRLPAGCTCNYGTPTRQPTLPAYGTSQLLADSQSLLQAAGRISKSMTDAMDVTKHNNVGINVAVQSTFGAVGKMMGLVSSTYRTLATTGAAAAQDAGALQVAATAVNESNEFANEAAAAANAAGKIGSVADPTFKASGYLTDAVYKGTALAQAPGSACGVYSCYRLTQILKTGTTANQLFSTLYNDTAGLTVVELQAGLKQLGVNAQVRSTFANLIADVKAGKPVIAAVNTTGIEGATLHGVVVESAQVRGATTYLTIYDPAGWTYEQPAASFTRYMRDLYLVVP